MKIVILGAGPTGLGAGYRLHELGHDDWHIFEAADHVGGLAASVTTPNGFVYDTGGHVMFSGYAYFHEMVNRVLGDAYTDIQRESWIRMSNRWVPYPFQNNVSFLEPEDALECLLGLAASRDNPSTASNFRDWTLATFGDGIARQFMFPYNFKVWAHPPELMSKDWIAERVSVVTLEGALRGLLSPRADKTWGPNSTFKFPLHGGTGGLYEGFHPFIAGHLTLGKRAVSVDAREKFVRFDDGHEERYDVLLSAMPLTQLVEMTPCVPDSLRDAASDLSWNSGLFVGIGVAREQEDDKCWVYFPEENCPFYRVTYLSRYSPFMAPPGHMSLVSETSHSRHKHVDRGRIVEETIDGMIATGILNECDRARIVDRTLIEVPYAYPVPTLRRDGALAAIQPWLMEHSIYSRGRFGAWLYEVGNMDHSVMQGVEFVNHVLSSTPENVWIAPAELPRVSATS